VSLHDHAIDMDTANALLANMGFDDYDPEPSQAVTVTPAAGSFDVQSWAAQHGVEIHSTLASNGETKYVLSHCVFDSNHKAPDAAIFQKQNGQLGYKCFHNSCSGKGWREARQAVEPGCYDRPQGPQARPFRSACWCSVTPRQARHRSRRCTGG